MARGLEQPPHVPNRAQQVLGGMQHTPCHDHVITTQLKPLPVRPDFHVKRLESHPPPQRLPSLASPFQERGRHVRVGVLGKLERAALLLELLQCSQDTRRHAPRASAHLEDA